MTVLAAIYVPVRIGIATTTDWRVGVLVVAVTVIAFAAAIVIGNRTPKSRPIRNQESDIDRKAA